MENGKKLVAYFSCSGVTARVAYALSEAAGADLYEIKPAAPYTIADLNWMDKKSRSSREMNDKSCRPEISGRVENMDDYSVVFVGFPVWWDVAPRIIQTFLESYNLSGKVIIPFCTSGGSGAGGSDRDLRRLYSSLNLQTCRRLGANVSQAELKSWINSLGL